MKTRDVIDKRGRLAAIRESRRGELELGCGSVRRHPQAVSVDAIDYEAVDVVGDVFDVLARLPDSSIDVVRSSHFVEHLDDLAALVQELGRVVKVGGLVYTVAPHFSNPYFYSDYTHRGAFGLYTFSYLAKDDIFRRKVPRYVETVFDLVSVRLIFKAPRPFYLRWAVGHVWQAIANASNLMKEWYESRLCYMVPCYEVEYVMTRRH